MAREQILWNKGWKFRHGDFPAAAAPAFDDSAWADICLPHSFGIPYFMEGPGGCLKDASELFAKCEFPPFQRGKKQGLTG